jgi:hypothetical protein
MKNLLTFEDFVLENLVLEAASSKDIQRIQDIVTKSNGDSNKMLTLANTMCKLITDKNKAYDRGLASDQILGSDHPVTKAFMDRAQALGLDVASKSAQVKVLPGSKRPSSEQFKTTRQFSSGYKGSGAAILPCGVLNLKTGQNKYFSLRDSYQVNSTVEIWEADDIYGKISYRAIITSGSNPIYQIGTKGYFAHDQTGRPLFQGIMVDYIEAPHTEELIPLYGKSITCYVYK